MICGKMVEQVAPPITAGRTRAVPDKEDTEHAEAVKDMKFLKRSEYLASVKNSNAKRL